MQRLYSLLVLAVLLLAASLAGWDRAHMALAASAQQSNSLELLMVEQDGCVYCEAWHAEIGPGYPKSDEGKAASLRTVDIEGPWPDSLVLDRRPTITPTFILLRDQVEISRLEGYPGSNFFYPLISEMIAQGQTQDAAN